MSMFQADRPDPSQKQENEQFEDPQSSSQSLGLEGLANGLEQTFEQILEDEQIDRSELEMLAEMNAEKLGQEQASKLMEALGAGEQEFISTDQLKEVETSAQLSAMVANGEISEQMASSLKELSRHHRVHGGKNAYGSGEALDESLSQSPDQNNESSMEEILEAMGVSQSEQQTSPISESNEMASMDDILQSLKEHGQKEGLITKQAVEVDELSIKEDTAISDAQKATIEALAQKQKALLSEMAGVETETTPAEQVSTEELVKNARQYLDPLAELEEIMEAQPLTQGDEEFVIGGTNSIAQVQEPSETVSSLEREAEGESLNDLSQDEGSRFDSRLSALADRKPKETPSFSIPEQEPAYSSADDYDPDFEGIFERAKSQSPVQNLAEQEQPVTAVTFKDGQMIISLKNV